MRLQNALTGLVILIALLFMAMNFYLLPLGNGRDELEILQVIDFYHDQQRFPILPDDWADSSWSAHHPPLYFMLMAGLIHFGLPDLESHSYQDYPFSDQNIQPLTSYNRVDIIQEKRGGKILTWYSLRALSVLLNLLTLGILWRTARLFFGPNPQISIPLVLAFWAMNPSALQFAVVVNNDNLIIFLSALVTWLLVLNFRLGFTWQRSSLLGLVLGLGLLGKLFIVPLIAPIFALYFLDARMSPLQKMKHLLILIVLAGGLSFWWYGRNYALYGDFTAVNQLEQLLGTHKSLGLTGSQAANLLAYLWGSVWLEAHLVVAPFQLQQYWSLFIWFLICLALLPRFFSLERGILLLSVISALAFWLYTANRNLHGANTALVRSCLPALSLLLADNLRLVFPRLQGALLGLCIALALFYQGFVFLPQYPPLRRNNRLEAAQTLDIEFEPGIRLLSYELSQNRAAPGEEIYLKLCWDATQAISQNYAFTAQLIAPDLPNAAMLNGFHASGRYPTSLWQPNDVFCERLPLKIQPETVNPKVYDLRVGLFDPQTRLDINFIQADGSLNHYLVLDRVGIAQPTNNKPHNLMLQVGDWGILEAYEIRPEEGKCHLDLNWFALGEPPDSYTYYLHVLDKNGELLAQLDRLPVYPTQFWQKGVRFSDSLSLAIPPKAASYRFGLYAPDFGRAEWFVEGSSVGDGLALRCDSDLVHP